MTLSILTQHRPTRFSDMVASPDLKLLMAANASGNLPHILLFSGEPGSGKTTAARIIARSLTKDNLDFMEINGAVNNGVDDTRRLIQGFYLHPISGDQKVVIIDECHRLTVDSQSALLKAVEDYPKHLTIIFATTHPSKMLDALRSRCIEYRFRNPDPTVTADLLVGIANRHETTLSRRSAVMIATACRGNVRDSLGALAKLIHSGNEITDEVVAESIGAINPETLQDISSKIPRSLESVVHLVEGVLADVTPDTLTDGLMDFWGDRLREFTLSGETAKAAMLRGWMLILNRWIAETQHLTDRGKQSMLLTLWIEINQSIKSPAPTPTPTPTPAPTQTQTPDPAELSQWEIIKARAIQDRPILVYALKDATGQVMGTTLRIIGIDNLVFQRQKTHLKQSALKSGIRILEVIQG